MSKEVDKWVFKINNEVVEEYAKLYFKKYPNRRKHPLAVNARTNVVRPCMPSVNQLNAMVRMAQNNWKQSWGKFIEFLVDKNGWRDLKLKNVKATVDFYFWDRRKKDIGDNYNLKFINDGLVSAGFLEDDNCTILQQVKYRYRGIDRENPRTVITFEKLKEEEIIKDNL